ncbi:hypothetical protein FHEFKHOI_00117 [Candidatus Methanoperedenaceae archaeon GB50]|nr:hypothetical protein FHEFKHOI_00117 [Candidatus Methanoperedenaceae archaeon GB50]
MDTIRLGIILIVIGFSVVLLGSLQGAESSTSVGGMVMIGPIPIIFGSSPLDNTWRCNSRTCYDDTLHLLCEAGEMNLIIVGIILILIGFLLIWSEILKLIFKRDTCMIEPGRS